MKTAKKIIVAVLALAVIGLTIPTLWPILDGAAGNVSAMAPGEAGGELVQAIFPVGLLLVGVAIGVGLLIFAVKKIGSFSKGR